MDESGNRPLTIFGISLKAIVFVVIFLLSLLLVIDRVDIADLLDSRRPPQKSVDYAESESPENNSRDIVATPEMITEAMRQVEIDRLNQLESSEHFEPTDRFFYIIELTNGSDLEATELTIEPDRVVLSSETGITTVIDRSSIKRIDRIKLPPEQP
jgi:hypothetical protein